MKKLLIVFAAGALLASCTSAIDKEAAAELCEHLKFEGESTNLVEMMEATQKKSENLKKWQAKYNGKVTDNFKEELKTTCPDGYETATEMGFFEASTETEE